MTRRVLRVALVGLGLLGVGLAASAAEVTLTGSTTVLPIAQAVAEAMADKYEIEVSGGGSSVGIASLIDGTTDIADHSRPMKGKEYAKAVENEVYPFTFHVANDAIAVIVHPSNPIGDLTLDQLKAIFTGKLTRWVQLDSSFPDPDATIVPIGRDSASGTFETWESLVLAGADPAASVAALPANAAVADAVAQNPNAIGYVGLAYVTPNHRQLTVGGKVATLESALNYTYPIARPLFMSTNGFPGPGAVLDVILFVLSDAGQQIVQEVGYAPIRILK